MEEPLNHRKIYTNNGSPKGAAHGEGVDDGTAERSDGETCEAVPRGFEEGEGTDSRYAGEGDGLQSLLRELGTTPLRETAFDEDRRADC